MLPAPKLKLDSSNTVFLFKGDFKTVLIAVYLWQSVLFFCLLGQSPLIEERLLTCALKLDYILFTPE